jgi:hypothetical protein
MYFLMVSCVMAGRCTEIADCPEVLAPEVFLKMRELHLELSGGFTFQMLDDSGNLRYTVGLRAADGCDLHQSHL